MILPLGPSLEQKEDVKEEEEEEEEREGGTAYPFRDGVPRQVSS